MTRTISASQAADIEYPKLSGNYPNTKICGLSGAAAHSSE
jgi:hypothetical protein